MKRIAALTAGLLAGLCTSSATAIVVEEIPLREPVPCVDAAEWKAMRTVAERNLAWLRADDLLAPADETLQVQFAWPLRPTASFSDFGYHVISSFVDHDPAYPDQLLDYECGERTYDTAAGVNHNGTDYVLWPFSWYKMDHDQVEIVAAADGTIFDKADGYPDHSCTPGGSTNKVAIRHSDGTMAWYIHMKTWSVTAKGIGETVVAGEYLGLVGSSGNSNIPHLHMDLRDADWNTFDPYGGPCNALSSASWWSDQRPYHDSSILAVLTHFAPPEYPECPQQEILNTRDKFVPADLVYYGIYHRDLLAGQIVEYAVLRPDTTVADSGSYSITEPHYPAAAALLEYQLPGSAQAGTWTIAIDYDGRRYERPFTVAGSGPPAAGRVPDGAGVPGAPLRVDKAPAEEITLDWSESCVSGDSDYNVYTGALGDFTSHAPIVCGNGGATERTFLPLDGNRYYLVVPTNGAVEGSYGAEGEGAERLQGSGVCAVQFVGACP